MDYIETSLKISFYCTKKTFHVVGRIGMLSPTGLGTHSRSVILFYFPNKHSPPFSPGLSEPLSAQFLCSTVCNVASVMSESMWPYWLWPARFLCPWDSPGKNYLSHITTHLFLSHLLLLRDYELVTQEYLQIFVSHPLHFPEVSLTAFSFLVQLYFCSLPPVLWSRSCHLLLTRPSKLHWLSCLLCSPFHWLLPNST